MKPNIGRTDRVIRIVVGCIIIAAGIFAGSWRGIVGMIPIVTAFLRWCPAYMPFGISTDKEPK